MQDQILEIKNFVLGKQKVSIKQVKSKLENVVNRVLPNFNRVLGNLLDKQERIED